MSVDLHIHTTSSDGRFSPEDVVAQARAVKLKAIAITDHDTVDGVIELETQGLLHPPDLTVVPGIEFSTDLPDNEVHILGYFINFHDKHLSQVLAKIVADRITRMERMVDKLEALGYKLDSNRIREKSGPARSIGRPHIAKALVEEGYFPTVSAVFEHLLQKGGPAYVPHYKLSPHETIELVKNAGGFSVLAHPGQIGSDAIVKEMIALGIQGLEVFHPGHSETDIRRYLALAQEFGLAVTGGSDFHAIPYRVPEHLGEFTLADDYYHLLVKAARSSTSAS